MCFLNKVDAVDDPELLDLVEMELRGMTGCSCILGATTVTRMSIILETFSIVVYFYGRTS